MLTNDIIENCHHTMARPSETMQMAMYKTCKMQYGPRTTISHLPTRNTAINTAQMEDSWCFYNRANALKLPESENGHDNKKLYLAKIPKQKLEYLKDVYKDLANRSSPEMSEGCYPEC